MKKRREYVRALRVCEVREGVVDVLEEEGEKNAEEDKEEWSSWSEFLDGIESADGSG